MTIERTREYFKKFHMEDRILEFDSSSATVELAAEAAGCEPARIAKTLSFMVDDQPILIVLAGDAKIDNPKYKKKFNSKAKMINPSLTNELIGYEIGGICPFAVNQGVSIYLDISLKRFKTVFPACGTSNSAIEVTIEELENHSHADEWVDVGRNWE